MKVGPYNTYPEHAHAADEAYHILAGEIFPRIGVGNESRWWWACWWFLRPWSKTGRARAYYYFNRWGLDQQKWFWNGSQESRYVIVLCKLFFRFRITSWSIHGNWHIPEQQNILSQNRWCDCPWTLWHSLNDHQGRILMTNSTAQQTIFGCLDFEPQACCVTPGTELRNVKSFTRSKSSKPNFTPRKVRKLRQI